MICVAACADARATHDGAAAGMSTAEADRNLASAITDSTQWPTYGRDFGNQRFAPLGQITAQNVASLQPRWTQHSGIPHSSESNPVVMGGVMYFSSAMNHVFAVYARTGRKLWGAKTAAGVNAPPIAYMIDGVQYVAVAATGAMNVGSHRGDAMMVYSLPQNVRGGQ
ncbi:MAG: hypothetical protein ACR2M1_13595 [Gemmatimonadaceae bacterium]